MKNIGRLIPWVCMVLGWFLLIETPARGQAVLESEGVRQEQRH